MSEALQYIELCPNGDIIKLPLLPILTVIGVTALGDIIIVSVEVLQDKTENIKSELALISLLTFAISPVIVIVNTPVTCGLSQPIVLVIVLKVIN